MIMFLNGSINGKIVQGSRGASGLAYGPESCNKGTIARQKTYFKTAGVERVDSWYEGTINFSIEPKKIKILKPDYIVTAEWKPNIIETFWLVDVIFQYNGNCFQAYVYYPCPSSVKTHPDNIIELLAEKIDYLKYGDTATVEFSNEKIMIID